MAAAATNIGDGVLQKRQRLGNLRGLGPFDLRQRLTLEEKACGLRQRGQRGIRRSDPRMRITASIAGTFRQFADEGCQSPGWDDVDPALFKWLVVHTDRN